MATVATSSEVASSACTKHTTVDCHQGEEQGFVETALVLLSQLQPVLSLRAPPFSPPRPYPLPEFYYFQSVLPFRSLLSRTLAQTSVSEVFLLAASAMSKHMTRRHDCTLSRLQPYRFIIIADCIPGNHLNSEDLVLLSSFAEEDSIGFIHGLR